MYDIAKHTSLSHQRLNYSLNFFMILCHQYDTTISKHARLLCHGRSYHGKKIYRAEMEMDARALHTSSLHQVLNYKPKKFYNVKTFLKIIKNII